jgi:hypothetical protein
MAFLRFTRDKRGYEQFSLVEATTNRRGKSRTRLLYWYRTPPNVRVGREPFDESVRRALEAQNPGVQFDWRKIVETPIPSAETERWRERRRAEKAEKVARRAEAAAAVPGEPDEIVETVESDRSDEIDEIDERAESEETAAELSAAPDRDEADAEADAASSPDAIDQDTTEAAADAAGDAERAAPAVAGHANPPGRRRRRRRGRRGRPAPSSSTPQGN